MYTTGTTVVLLYLALWLCKKAKHQSFIVAHSVEEHSLLTSPDFEMHPYLLGERALNAKMNRRFWLLIAQQSIHQNARPDLTMSLLGVRI
jgi:hypothetical protein